MQDFSVPSSSTFPLPSISPPKVLSDLLAALLEEDTEEAIEKDIIKAEVDTKTMKEQVIQALVKSANGRRLISFEDLPDKWQNNEYVREGYRLVIRTHPSNPPLMMVPGSSPSKNGLRCCCPYSNYTTKHVRNIHT